nr:queuosine precursor transporter [uncultured Cohaesibacter sp.]
MVATRKNLGLSVLAMVGVVAASNYLVQFPFEPFGLQDLLTWGAFTYPMAFLVTDLTNRKCGPKNARIVVAAGFAIAVLISIWLATPRIAIASGSAFLVAQLLDITIFNRLRRNSWWKAPLASSFFGSVLDTVVFFGISFAASFAFLDTGFGMAPDMFPTEASSLLSLGIIDAPRWVSWAIVDYSCKMFVALLMLAPYRLLLSRQDALTVAA